MLNPEFSQIILHSNNLVDPVFDVLFMFDLFIEDRNGHMVGVMIFPACEIGNLLVALDGAAFSPEILLKNSFDIRINGFLIFTPVFV